METRRRWIASILEGMIGVGLWAMGAALVPILLIVQVVQKSGMEFSMQNLLSLIVNLPSLVASVASLFYLIFCCGALPMFIVTTLGAYHQHKITGDSLIDRFWKNPKIKDG